MISDCSTLSTLNFWNELFHLLRRYVHCSKQRWKSKIKKRMANSVDPDETACYEQSDLDLHCLHRYLFWSAGLKLLTFKSQITIAALGSSVGCASDWWSGGCRFHLGRVGNILLWRLIMKYFLRSFSPFHWVQKGSCQFLVKECAQYSFTA